MGARETILASKLKCEWKQFKHLKGHVSDNISTSTVKAWNKRQLKSESWRLTQVFRTTCLFPLYLTKWVLLEKVCVTFKLFIHNVEKWLNIHLKSCGVKVFGHLNTAIFYK